MLNYFSQPPFEVGLGFAVGQVMDEDKTLIISVEDVSRIPMTMRASDVA